MSDHNYAALDEVFNRAYTRAAYGKGKERHANGNNFEDQLGVWIATNIKSFPLGQAIKKIVESQRLGCEESVAELLDSINYISMEIIAKEKEQVD